ncbi:hypothetical protein F5Y08DRAFT_302923 [Xylaria arbuscula]|nr:hypothetical protein F5Y08DRAFT_302923 [Xylaria arbuscula]
MRFTIATTVFALAIGAIAAPNGYPGGGNGGNGDVTVGQNGDSCGRDLEINCCNKVKQTGDTTKAAEGALSGLDLSGLAGELGLFDNCSKLGISALIGIQDLLNGGVCKQQLACCQGNSASADNALVGVALPCVAIGGLL